AGVVVPTLASGQAGPPGPGGAPGGAVVVPAPAPGQAQLPAPYSIYAPVPSPAATSSGNTAPSGPLGGGNATESSARPITGGEEDSFDFRGSAGGGAVHGSDSGPVFTLGKAGYAGEPPSSHVVRRGDTLWALCDFYFKNPYQWPRVWSYNPQIKNPNWIYPGDELRLKATAGPEEGGGKGEAGAKPVPRDATKMSLVDRRRQVPNDTLFLRDQGWIRDESDDVWGEVSGSPEESMFLSDLNEAYLTLREGHNVHIGQELTIFRTRETVAAGSIVQILGTARIDDWNPRERVARAKIVEALDVIERGAKVGPLARSFAIVPPLRNEHDVHAHVLASLRPNEFFGQNQVVFIDKGEAAGLKPGNRLFVVRRGDAWRQTLVNPEAGHRISPDDERPMPPMEQTPGAHGDDAKFPEEVVAELRVLGVKKDTATCLVTQSRTEIELRDLAVARKGY
ncbi:MAG TPA: LysM peptidoglycan-binding domain-containing protein, partial [Polyangiaceae bacterium]|nr:LysM peptidoglycan-binding domain-containing protein [Polyangiaceae bacterium]